jgi:dienelactone hydrolase
MTRRELFQTALALGASQLVSKAQVNPSIPAFPGTRFRPYFRCLPDYLTSLATSAVHRRDAALAKLTSPAAIQDRQKWARETLWTLIGGPSEKTPLNARVTGVLDRDGYRVEKVVYESQPNLIVAANLYVPKQGSGPFPAVLFQSGHYWEGKASPSYQRCCQGLVQLGFVVLAFDPMGQGERINYLDASGKASRLQSPDLEHTHPGKQLLLFGDSTTRLQLWDAVRSLDYLASLPDVDAKRIASAGHSGGATLTMLLAAADPRLAAAAVCMGNTENVAALPFHSPGSTDDAEQDFVYSGPVGFDRWDLFYPFAPKPMLIWPSDRDFEATYSSEYIRNGWEEYQKLKRVYEQLNHADRLGWADTPLPHALAYDSRMLIYNWFTRWLKNDAHPIKNEPPVKPESVSDLWATESGSVVRSLNSTTPFILNKSRHVEKSGAPLESLLKITPTSAGVRAATIGHVQSRNIRVEVLEIPSAPGVWLPAFLLLPDGVAKSKPVLLALDEEASDRLWFSPEVDQILPESGPVVCTADIRGIGTLVPQFGPGSASYSAWHHEEENYAWGSLILGEPLVGQRVTDILALLAALRKHPATAGRAIHVAAQGKLTVPALFAAAIDKNIQSLYLAEPLVSFQNVVETEMYSHPFANFVPSLLKHTDLPEIAASVTVPRVIMAGVVDATGKAIPVDAAKDSYSDAIHAGHLTIEPRAEWSVESLLAQLHGERRS